MARKVTRRDNNLAARALAEWAREGFGRAAADKIAATYGVSPRTVWNWKAALGDDPDLAALFRARINDILDRDWAAHLSDALLELVERIRALAATETNLEVVVEAFRALSEVEITREVLRGAADAGSHRGDEAARGETAVTGAPLPN